MTSISELISALMDAGAFPALIDASDLVAGSEMGAEPFDRNGAADHGGDGPGDHRRQSDEPASRHQHGDRRRNCAFHPGRVATVPGNEEKIELISSIPLSFRFCSLLLTDHDPRV